MDKQAGVSHDPIDALIDSGVPARVLIGHQLCSIDWLSARLDHKFRLCYFNEDGRLSTEDVTAAQLLLRGKGLGWHPLEDEPTESGWPFLFEEAIYHYRNGIHWYASATSDTDGMLPLAFPRSVIEADRRRTERKTKLAGIRRQRQEAARARAAAAEARATRAGRIVRLAERMHLEAHLAGRPISASAARRKAKAWWRQWEQDIASAMQSLTDNQGDVQDGR